MQSVDLATIALVEAQGRSMGELFLVQDRVYWSADSGDFGAESTYAPYELGSGESEASLVSLLKRLAAPAYESICQLDDEISLLNEWGSLYEELTNVLGRHGKHCDIGQGDYYLVDDCYSLPQHKIECSSEEAFTPELVADVQSVLMKYKSNWEVIFALPSAGEVSHAFSVYASSCVERDG